MVNTTITILKSNRAGKKSKNHGTALKRSCGPAMSTLHSLITMQMGGGLQDQVNAGVKDITRFTFILTHLPVNVF